MSITTGAAMTSSVIPTTQALSAMMAAVPRAYNFSAGPSVLPDEVIRQAQEELWSVRGTGIGILEHSHRAKTYDAILAEAFDDCRKIAHIPANYKPVFLTGGATTQNSMIPKNLLSDGGTADFLTTGYWAEKTFDECKLFGKPHEAWDGRPHKHAFCPADHELKYSAHPEFVHMCTNNTIYGTQWRHADGTMRYPKIPQGTFLIADMSSDIYSRPIDVNKFGMIYAGAQKNIGVAGCTLAIIRDDVIARAQELIKQGKKKPLATMDRYDIHAKDESRHNTPPVFSIYMSGLMFKWILKQGGLEVIHKRNLDKAKLIYDVLDSSTFYKGHARLDSRSLMNITFKTPSEQLDDLFLKEAAKHAMDQLKGHRSTGGIRASTYNAMPKDGCKALADFMKDFEKKNG